MTQNTSSPLSQLRATCILEPKGAAGLEGYSCGEQYRYEYRPENRVGTVESDNGVITDRSAQLSDAYYRVWPVADDTYYETCSVRAFKKYFKASA
jgi:hypothetical protein